ncbi:hypothetical protein [Blastococcus saxobsidens]|uniref:Uncharacterized protein n=1 Tax=Blastococcus saxobsidens TaxID=138336 RepID=A0A4Q7Y1Z6_9ACTN|nr:hypothetical protein [Blastococcus saxobsidens]RZU30820.1 hypothetical protein BKA19_0448 [Blastococcus saxobsidens]
MTHAHQDDVRHFAGGFVSPSQEDLAGDDPVIHHLSVFKTRARMLDGSRVERKAQELQAASSYDDWDGLTDADKELWRHMARLDLC